MAGLLALNAECRKAGRVVELRSVTLKTRDFRLCASKFVFNLTTLGSL